MRQAAMNPRNRAAVEGQPPPYTPNPPEATMSQPLAIGVVLLFSHLHRIA